MLNHGARVILVARGQDKLEGECSRLMSDAVPNDCSRSTLTYAWPATKQTAARSELLQDLGSSAAAATRENGAGEGDQADALLPRVVLVAQDVSAGEEPLTQALAPAIEQLGGRVDVRSLAFFILKTHAPLPSV